MRIYWCQWQPDPKTHEQDAVLPDVLTDLLSRGSIHESTFWGFWSSWVLKFPDCWKLVTVTTKHSCFSNQVVFSMRLWFGEPDSVRADHVDSMGHNLIVHIESAHRRDLLTMVYQLLPKNEQGWVHTEENGADVWRRQDGNRE